MVDAGSCKTARRCRGKEMERLDQPLIVKCSIMTGVI
ncbi:MAG: hypothetical protein D6E12_10925 [Desulfovibrio sp.]|nr:MAG: hypothetical protein D6E12_10925 [Desulfovibrio sp.]